MRLFFTLSEKSALPGKGGYLQDPALFRNCRGKAPPPLCRGTAVHASGISAAGNRFLPVRAAAVPFGIMVTDVYMRDVFPHRPYHIVERMAASHRLLEVEDEMGFSPSLSRMARDRRYPTTGTAPHFPARAGLRTAPRNHITLQNGKWTLPWEAHYPAGLRASPQ